MKLSRIWRTPPKIIIRTRSRLSTLRAGKRRLTQGGKLMTKYNISTHETFNRHYKVEANSKQEAIQLVRDEAVRHYDEDFVKFTIDRYSVEIEEQALESIRRDAEHKKHCYDRAKEICNQNEVFDDLIEGFQKWYYHFALVHDKEYPYTDYANDEVDPQDVDLIHTWWLESCDQYENYTCDWESPFKDLWREKLAIEAEEEHERNN